MVFSVMLLQVSLHTNQLLHKIMQNLFEQCIFLLLLHTKTQRKPWLVTTAMVRWLAAHSPKVCSMANQHISKQKWFLVPLKIECWHLTEGRPFLERLSYRSCGNWSMVFGRREVRDLYLESSSRFTGWKQNKYSKNNKWWARICLPVGQFLHF